MAVIVADIELVVDVEVLVVVVDVEMVVVVVVDMLNWLL